MYELSKWIAITSLVLIGAGVLLWLQFSGIPAIEYCLGFSVVLLILNSIDIRLKKKDEEK